VGAGVHMTAAKREAGELVRERGVGQECQHVHIAVAERDRRTSRDAWDRAQSVSVECKGHKFV
jgi:hypothetical protein